MNKPKTCPDCGEEHPLHEIDDFSYGCDNCKNIFMEKHFPVPSLEKEGKDKDGNDLFPEEVL